MDSSSLQPATRRLLGLLLILTGILFGLGLLLKMSIAAYQFSLYGTEFLGVAEMSINLLGLVGASLLVRYGRRLRRGGHLSDGPAEETIL